MNEIDHCQSGVFFMERKGFSPAILFVRVWRIPLLVYEGQSRTFCRIYGQGAAVWWDTWPFMTLRYCFWVSEDWWFLSDVSSCLPLLDSTFFSYGSWIVLFLACFWHQKCGLHFSSLFLDFFLLNPFACADFTSPDLQVLVWYHFKICHLEDEV